MLKLCLGFAFDGFSFLLARQTASKMKDFP